MPFQFFNYVTTMSYLFISFMPELQPIHTWQMLLLYLIYSPSFSGPISHSCLTYPLFIDDLYTCSYMAYGPAYLAYGPTHIGLMNLLITGLWTHSYLVYEPTHNWFMDLLISDLQTHSYLVYEPTHIWLINLLITGSWTHSHLAYSPTHIRFMSLLISGLWTYSYLSYGFTHLWFMNPNMPVLQPTHLSSIPILLSFISYSFRLILSIPISPIKFPQYSQPPIPFLSIPPIKIVFSISGPGFVANFFHRDITEFNDASIQCM